MSFNSRPLTSIFIFLISFVLAWMATNSFGFIATGGWTGLYNLLIGYPMYILVFISTMALCFFYFGRY